jgi:hypothetical protein
MLLNLRPEELACFKRLAVEGPSKCAAPSELFDRGWITYRGEDGTIALTVDGIEVARAVGLAPAGKIDDGDLAPWRRRSARAGR